MTTPVLYGIPNCDTVRKARRWLDERGVAYRFHDLRADGLRAEVVAHWLAAVGYETLINTRGTTWRQLPAPTREGLSADTAVALMQAHPTVIKRPVVEWGDAVTVGFDPDDWATRSA